MSDKNSKMDDDHQSTSKTVNQSSLRSKNSIERERRRKLVKFNAIAEIKEVSEDSSDSKLNAMNEQPTIREPVTSTADKEKKANVSFHSKRRSHYKNEFTNSKTSSKNSETTD